MAKSLTIDHRHTQTELPAAFADAKPDYELANSVETGSEGVSGGFGLIRYKGKTWSLSFRGENYPFMRADGDGPLNSIEVVILKASLTKSKTYFPSYKPDERAKPVCWSNNAITPAADVPEPQHDNCALCPKNQIGSRTTDDGRKARACSDAKRIAVALEPRLASALTGLDFFEPLLLRIPASGLTDFGAYGDRMKKRGFALPAILTKISFDPQVEYPKFVFTPIRPLEPEEKAAAWELRSDPRTDRIVMEELEHKDALPAAFQIAKASVKALEAPKASASAGVETVAPAPKPTMVKAAAQAAVQARAPLPSIPDEDEVEEAEVIPPSPPLAPAQRITKPAVKKADKKAAAPPPPAEPEEPVDEDGEELPEGDDSDFNDRLAGLLGKLK
jgi:hypothetical protein